MTLDPDFVRDIGYVVTIAIVLYGIAGELWAWWSDR